MAAVTGLSDIPPEFRGLTVDEMREAAAALSDAVDFAEVIRDEVGGQVTIDARLSPRVSKALIALITRLRAEGTWPPL